MFIIAKTFKRVWIWNMEESLGLWMGGVFFFEFIVIVVQSLSHV